MLFLAAFLVFIFFAIRFFLQRDPVKIVGIYSQPGKWYTLKFKLMRAIIAYRQRKQKKSKESTSKEDLMTSQWGGDGGERPPHEMEKKHDLPLSKPRAADAVFLNASSREGFYFILGTAQRHDNIINLFLVLRVPGVGTFVNKEMFSNTNVKSVHSPGNNEWRTESGFVLACDEPMKRWRASYNGPLYAPKGKKNFTATGAEPEPTDLEPIDAKFDFTWTNFGECFDFDRQVSPTAIAHSLAIEPWSRPLFDKMRASHQTHYEQFGFLTGNLKLGYEEYHGLRMTSMRDHTITGYRNWSDLRRYIMMVYHLEDGTCIHTSVVSMPETVFTSLEFGYVVLPDQKVVPVDRVHFSLANHGEDRHFPDAFHYSFEAASHTYNVDVKIVETVSFKMGLDLTAQVNENMAEFVVNGVRGWGTAECEYRIQPY
ncbi:unnamed protein product [Caenorhabditis auriculariae]|uniref:DUF7064 domain-containing protein n=1 Tax=Caenorhabditis auriculariae TaxID=2777116 RepID=A0A8S1H6P5_9PELO|nr:unnamed protein product [Caenorhabditis auriculariae]